MLLIISRLVQLCCWFHRWLVRKALRWNRGFYWREWWRSHVFMIPWNFNPKCCGIKKNWNPKVERSNSASVYWSFRDRVRFQLEGFYFFGQTCCKASTCRPTADVFRPPCRKSTEHAFNSCHVQTVSRKEIDIGSDPHWDATIYPWGGLGTGRHSPLNLSTQNRNYLQGGIRGEAKGEMGTCRL